MKKPVIGIIPGFDPLTRQCYQRKQVFQALRQAGGIPVLLFLKDDPAFLHQLAEMYDGFLFSGSESFSFEIHQETAAPCCNHCPADWKQLQSLFLHILINLDKPVLAIGQGMHLINSALGGTLYQDLLAFHPTAGDHHQPLPEDQPFHFNLLPAHTPLEQLLHTSSLEVNSLHHQGICHLAPSLKAMALSDDDVIEAFYAPQCRFFWGLQWNPEYLTDADPMQRRIFEAFLKECMQSQFDLFSKHQKRTVCHTELNQ